MRQTEYAQVIAVLRLSFDSLAAIELALTDSPAAWTRFGRLVDNERRTSDIRTWLGRHVWTPSGARDVWGNPLGSYVGALSKSFNPCSHFSGPLLQWHMKMIVPPGKSHGFVTFGGNYVDTARKSRLEALIAFLVWQLGRAVEAQVDRGPGESAPSDLVMRVQDLAVWLNGNEWLQGGCGWDSVLMPHVYDAARA